MIGEKKKERRKREDDTNYDINFDVKYRKNESFIDLVRIKEKKKKWRYFRY